MKTFFWLAKAVCKPSNPLTQRLHWSSFAAILFVVLLASTWPATAKVVYTPVNVTITGNGSIEMDLNHDGINDFKIQAAGKWFGCINRVVGLDGSVTINPTTGNGIVVKGSTGDAALLPHGVQINSRANFYKAKTVISEFSLCASETYTASGYLGLEFQIKGETHYGWALVNVFARGGFPGGGMHTTLIGFAYETIPGSPVNTGQISGAAADPTAAGPGSRNREDFRPDIAVAPPMQYPPTLSFRSGSTEPAPRLTAQTQRRQS